MEKKEQTFTVVENCEQLTLTTVEFERVSDILYYCNECKHHHIKNGFNMDLVERRAKDQ
jgi:hypothetical protein